MPLSVKEQLAVIRRGVEKIVPEEDLAQLLQNSLDTGKPLRVKYGIDPTGIDVHLGHTVPLRKMRQFQELGHQAVIIIGNYTALVGDPSGRDETRARLTQEQVEANAQNYLNQVSKVIDLDKAEVVHNGDWFGRMSFLDILELCSKVTVAQLLTRDDFSKRFKAESPIFLHECLYPVMQAWDSVMVKSDIELGGTEQLYSFMLARDLQRHQNMPGQIGIMSPILVGTDGSRRMGKSLDNYIGISEAPYEMMKKFMQLPDDCMKMYYELLTDLPLDEVDKLLSGHPKEAKLRLAKTIIAEYCTQSKSIESTTVMETASGVDPGKSVSVGQATETSTAGGVTPQQIANESADRWQREIGGDALPQEIPTAEIARSELTDGKIPAAVLLKQAGLCSSTSEARRSISQGSAKLGEEKTKIESHDQLIKVTDGLLLWVGKKRFCQIELTN